MDKAIQRITSMVNLCELDLKSPWNFLPHERAAIRGEIRALRRVLDIIEQETARTPEQVYLDETYGPDVETRTVY